MPSYFITIAIADFTITFVVARQHILLIFAFESLTNASPQYSVAQKKKKSVFRSRDDFIFGVAKPDIKKGVQNGKQKVLTFLFKKLSSAFDTLHSDERQKGSTFFF